MTIHEVLEQVRSVKQNQYDDETLVRWISELDGHIWEDLLRHYEDPAERGSRGEDGAAGAVQHRSPRPKGARAVYGVAAPSLPYDAERDMNTTPLAPFPHDGIYQTWLSALIDYHNGEFERYENAMMLYNAQLSAFSDACVRAYMPATKTVIYI